MLKATQTVIAVLLNTHTHAHVYLRINNNTLFPWSLVLLKLKYCIRFSFPFGGFRGFFFFMTIDIERLTEDFIGSFHFSTRDTLEGDEGSKRLLSLLTISVNAFFTFCVPNLQEAKGEEGKKKQKEICLTPKAKRNSRCKSFVSFLLHPSLSNPQEVNTTTRVRSPWKSSRLLPFFGNNPAGRVQVDVTAEWI